MKKIQVAAASLTGSLAAFTTICPVKKQALFFPWIHSAPFFGLCALVFIFLALNTRQYLRHKNPAAFMPLAAGATFILLIILLAKRQEALDNSPTRFVASTREIGNDGGLFLDFKENGRLVATRGDHWQVTRYRGKYSQENNVIELDIPFDFELGKKAVLTDSSLVFPGDIAPFQVCKR